MNEETKELLSVIGEYALEVVILRRQLALLTTDLERMKQQVSEIQSKIEATPD